MSAPVELDRVQGALTTALEALYGAEVTVLWAPSEFPREASEDALVAARLLTGPSFVIGERGGLGTYDMPQTATIAVDALPAAGTRAVVEIAGAWWGHDVTAGQTQQQVRDAILALLEDADGPAFDATIEAFGASSIELTATDPAGLWGLSVGGPLTLTVDAELEAAVQIQHAAYTVEVQASSTFRYPRAGAASLLGRLLQHVRMPSFRDGLARWGVAMWDPPSPVIDLSALEPDRSRAATQIRLVTLSVAAESVAIAEAATFTLDVVEGDAVIETITIETSPEP